MHASDKPVTGASHCQVGQYPTIAVLLPCFNEEAAIGKVVADFRASLPSAAIYVYDNNSRDRTAEIARAAGAIVRHEMIQGKGSVVRRMFADVEADIYVLADGDGTYDAADASTFVSRLLDDRLDLVNGRRVTSLKAAYRPGHRLGNVLLTGLVGLIFGRQLTDMLSGYKVVSHRFVKSFPALSQGFEIETELTVHALELGMPVLELPTAYGERQQDSPSKLKTMRDGLKILRTIVQLVRAERPLQFFSLVFLGLAAVSILLAIPLVATYLETGLVPRLPTAVLSAAIMLLAFISLSVGLILDTVTRGRQEMKRLYYLSFPAKRED